MNIFREGKPNDLDPSRADVLSVEINQHDIEALADPARGQTMDRFASFERGVIGWAREDKAHIKLDRPHSPEKSEQLVSLWCDPGGDLYFTIWEGERLMRSEAAENFPDVHAILESDPNRHIRTAGIHAVRFYFLDELARELKKPSGSL